MLSLLLPSKFCSQAGCYAIERDYGVAVIRKKHTSDIYLEIRELKLVIYERTYTVLFGFQRAKFFKRVTLINSDRTFCSRIKAKGISCL